MSIFRTQCLFIETKYLLEYNFIMINLSNVSKNFGRTRAVTNLSLNVEEGEIYGFIGPNGAGKTTTIKMIVGLLTPTRGRVEVGGYDLNREAEKAKKLIGYVPDDPFVYERLTGREFLHFVGEIYGIAENARKIKIEKLLNIFPIENIIDSYVEDYSRGNKQKIAILAALLHEPKVLVIDEPVVGIDPDGARISEKIFIDFAKEGGTIFVSTHTLSIAEKICTRIGIIKEGKLVKEGTLFDLKRSVRLADDKSLEDLYFRLTS